MQQNKPNTASNPSREKYISVAALALCLLSLVGAILFFAIVAPANSGFIKVMCVLCGILFALLFIMCAVYVYLDKKDEPNFFLLDRKTHKNIPLSELDFNMVNDKMTFYMTLIAKSPYELWQGDVLLKKFKGEKGAAKAYLPIVVYKMLYDLSSGEDSDTWEAFSACSPETLGFVCSVLEKNGEGEVAKLIAYIHHPRGSYADRIRESLVSNQKFFAHHMISYVKNNIEAFY